MWFNVTSRGRERPLYVLLTGLKCSTLSILKTILLPYRKHSTSSAIRENSYKDADAENVNFRVVSSKLFLSSHNSRLSTFTLSFLSTLDNFHFVNPHNSKQTTFIVSLHSTIARRHSFSHNSSQTTFSNSSLQL